MAVLTSNVSVNFSLDGVSSLLRLEKDDRDQASLRTQYIRAFPSQLGKIFATAGSIVGAGSSTADIEEILNFSNSDTVSLGYPDATNVKITLLGQLYAQDGSPVSGNISFDKAANAIRASSKAYGVVSITYKAKYRLYKYKYSGWGCTYESDYSGPASPPQGYKPYDNAVIVLYESSSGVSTSLTLEGPKCSFKGVKQNRDGKAGKIVLEVDPDNPIAMVPSSVSGLASTKAAAETKIRQYPDVDAKLKARYGVLGTVVPRLNEIKEEVLNFTESNGATLKYPPANQVTFSVLSPSIIDEWGRTMSGVLGVRFNTEGKVVQDVRWTDNPDEYTGNPIDRVVQPGEVVVTDAVGRVIRITANVSATYSSSYRLIRYSFARDPDAAEGTVKFLKDYLVATRKKAGKEDQFGDLELTPPSTSVGVDLYVAPDVST